MPLYEYECTACHKHTEKIQKFSDAEITICPHCGGPLERTITAPAFQFAGGGWYKDGYGSAKPAAGGESTSDKPAAAPSAGSGESVAPSTPAATPAASAPASASAAPAKT